MPKRIIDGESLWRSDKLARVEPTWMRAEFANLLPLSLANGVFESDPRRIWSLVYSYNRPDITLKDVESLLAEYERVFLLFRWIDAATAKAWGYWVGIEKSGRLPSASRLQKKHEATGPNPPADELCAFISRYSNQWLAKGQGGFGSGFGFGSGSGANASVPSAPAQEPRLTCVGKNSKEQLEGFEEFYKAYPKKKARKDAAKAWRTCPTEARLAIMAAVARFRGTAEWRREGGRYIPNPAKFLRNERWKDEIGESLVPNGGSQSSASTEATREEATRKLRDYGVKGLECQMIPSR